MSEDTKTGSSITGFIVIAVVVVYLGLEVYGFHHARERMDPAAVYREFVGARHAVALCEPSPPAPADFERNFTAVTSLASRDLAATLPEATDALIDQTLSEQRLAREQEVEALVAEEGCDGPTVWRLVKLYEVRGRLKLRY